MKSKYINILGLENEDIAKTLKEWSSSKTEREQIIRSVIIDRHSKIGHLLKIL